MAYKRKFKSKFSKSKKSKSSKRKISKKTATAVRKIAKSVLMKEAEPKHVGYMHAKHEVYHNIFLPSYCNTLNAVVPGQGVSDRQRIGDRVKCTHITIKALIGQKSDRPNVSWRMLVFSLPPGNSLVQSTVFENSLGRPIIDDVNTDIIKLHYDRTFRPNQAGLNATGNDEYTFFKKVVIPVNKTYKFGPADAAATHNIDPMYCAIIAYDAYGTLETDNIGYTQVYSDFHFKDI